MTAKRKELNTIENWLSIGKTNQLDIGRTHTRQPPSAASNVAYGFTRV